MRAVGTPTKAGAESCDAQIRSIRKLRCVSPEPIVTAFAELVWDDLLHDRRGVRGYGLAQQSDILEGLADDLNAYLDRVNFSIAPT